MTTSGQSEARAPGVIGEAVLLDYPLRLWLRQQEHTEEMLREFQLLLAGQESGQTSGSAPAQLVELADMFTSRFGALLEKIDAARREAVLRGCDRMDSRIPLVEGTPELLARVQQVLRVVDDYCRHGDLLMLARTPEQVGLSQWTTQELVRQYAGEAPTPWPGPF